jgi:serine/threonine-protein kinase
MAERDTLLKTLPPTVREEAEKLYTGEASPDPRDVVAELHRKGRITNAELRGSLLQLEAGLPIRRVKEVPPSDPKPTVLGPLGEGAMGEVLLARDEGLNRVVALKRLHGDHSSNRALMRRFYTEAQVTAQLDHPSIVPIHGLYTDETGGLSYAMKLVRGHTLEDYLEEAEKQERAGRVDRDHNLQARLERFLHVCDALWYAHEKGVLHRDLKPENIMVGAFGEVVVMDWGIAKLLAGSEVEIINDELNQSRKANQTKVGRIMGTPRYMSPEQAAGKNDTIDARSDQYAMGLILQELVSFTPACPMNITLEQALARAMKGSRQPMKARAGAACPRELVAIVDKACQVDPNRRYASIADLAEDVRRYLRDEAVVARPDTMMQRMGRFVGRHRTGVLLLISMLFTALVLSTGSLLFLGVGAHEFRRYQMATREARLMEVLAGTLDRAHAVDGELRHFQALVTGLSYAAERALAPVGEEKLPDNYDLERPPPGKRASSAYGEAIAVERPSIEHTGQRLTDAQAEQVARLVILGPQLGRLLVESSGRTKAKLDRLARHKIVANGVPARWVRVGTEEGVVATVPGIDAIQQTRNVHKRDWYEVVADGRGVHWMEPRRDERKGGLLLTVAYPLFDNGGKPHGSVAIDMVLDHLLGTMAPPQGGNAWLLDAKSGKVIATPKMKGADRYDPPPFPSTNVWERVKGSDGDGWVEVGDQVFSWSHLGSAPWVYVVQQAF